MVNQASERAYVVRTAHHGGGIVSKHPTPALARTAAIRARLLAPCPDCPTVETVKAEEYNSLLSAGSMKANLYSAARD